MPANTSPAKHARLTVPADVADRLRAEAARQNVDLMTLLTDISSRCTSNRPSGAHGRICPSTSPTRWRQSALTTRARASCRNGSGNAAYRFSQEQRQRVGGFCYERADNSSSPIRGASPALMRITTSPGRVCSISKPAVSSTEPL